MTSVVEVAPVGIGRDVPIVVVEPLITVLMAGFVRSGAVPVPAPTAFLPPWNLGVVMVVGLDGDVVVDNRDDDTDADRPGSRLVDFAGLARVPGEGGRLVLSRLRLAGSAA